MQIEECERTTHRPMQRERAKARAKTSLSDVDASGGMLAEAFPAQETKSYCRNDH